MADFQKVITPAVYNDLRAAEIKLRASRRCGELSKELEKAKYDKGHGVIPTNGKYKGEVLKSAGLTIPTAYRYEDLASVPTKHFEANPFTR